MELRADARIPFPRDLVFRTYRDEMPNLLSYLPNVRSITVTSRKEQGQVLDLVNEWRGGGDVPAAVRAVISEAALSWTDYASWNADLLTCDWRTETHAFKEGMRSFGKNTFLDDGPGKTLLEIRGNLDIDPKKLRGVPGLLAGKVARMAEEFLVSKIQTTLLETATGVTRYLQEHAK